MDFKFCPILHCSPGEAGFDGAKGIGLNHAAMHNGGLYQLRRGSTDPRSMPHDFKNQLIWYMPKDKPAELLWCNSKGEWFTCIFQREDPAQLS